MTFSSIAAGCNVIKQLLAVWIDLAGRINIPVAFLKLLYLMKPSEEGDRVAFGLVLTKTLRSLRSLLASNSSVFIQILVKLFEFTI